MPKTQKREFGDKGESFACEFLVKHGFAVLERNYLRKWGELDIISQKEGILHFIEVKSVSRESFYLNASNNINVIRETLGSYRPEDNMHPWKLQRIARTIQSYLIEKRVSEKVEWKFDVVTVYVNKAGDLVHIEMLDDVII